MTFFDFFWTSANATKPPKPAVMRQRPDPKAVAADTLPKFITVKTKPLPKQRAKQGS